MVQVGRGPAPTACAINVALVLGVPPQGPRQLPLGEMRLAILTGPGTSEAFSEEVLLSWATAGCWSWGLPLWPGSGVPGPPLIPSMEAQAFPAPGAHPWPLQAILPLCPGRGAGWAPPPQSWLWDPQG